jgi:hypothetical protein
MYVVGSAAGGPWMHGMEGLSDVAATCNEFPCSFKFYLRATIGIRVQASLLATHIYTFVCLFRAPPPPTPRELKLFHSPLNRLASKAPAAHFGFCEKRSFAIDGFVRGFLN